MQSAWHKCWSHLLKNLEGSTCLLNHETVMPICHLGIYVCSMKQTQSALDDLCRAKRLFFCAFESWACPSARPTLHFPPVLFCDMATTSRQSQYDGSSRRFVVLGVSIYIQVAVLLPLDCIGVSLSVLLVDCNEFPTVVIFSSYVLCSYHSLPTKTRGLAGSGMTLCRLESLHIDIYVKPRVSN